LQHHHDDLVAGHLARGLHADTARHLAEQELGDPDVLAEEMLDRPELQSFGSRFPRLVFLALPTLSFIAAAVLLVLTFIALMQGFFTTDPENFVPPPAWVKTGVEYFRLFLMHGLAPLLSCGFLAWGLRQRIPGKLLYSGIFLVNLLSCAILVHNQWANPAAGIDESYFGASIGYGFFNPRATMNTWIRLAVTLSLLAVFGWCYHRKVARE
jgi:hypothetical protein